MAGMNNLNFEALTISLEAAGHIKENIEQTGLEDLVDDEVSSVLPTLVLYNIVRDFIRLYETSVACGSFDTEQLLNNKTIH